MTHFLTKNHPNFTPKNTPQNHPNFTPPYAQKKSSDFGGGSLGGGGGGGKMGLGITISHKIA